MSIPGFTAERSLAAGQPRDSYYQGHAVRAFDAVAPQAGRGGSGAGLPFGFSGCFVNCIKRSGGSDAEAAIRNCAWICEKFGGSIVFVQQ